MKLVRIPTSELDNIWSLVEKDIKGALAYSSQLTDSQFVYELSKQSKYQIWIYCEFQAFLKSSDQQDGL